MLELEKQLPTLRTLLKQIVPQPAEQRPHLCLVASKLLKSRHQQLGLVQRVVSTILYRNGSSKQVKKILEHFMKLVPTLPADGHKVLPNGSILEFDDIAFSKVLIGETN